MVDNGSIDGSAEAITRSFPDVRIVRLLENRGFTGGVAAGLELCTGEFVVLLNNDTVAEDGWLAALIEAIERSDADVAAVSGKIIDMEGVRADFIGGALTFDGHAFQLDFRRPLSEPLREPADGAELLFACGGNMIVRRETFARLGGFDLDYFAYLEDVDFGWRVWLSGHRILYASRGVVRHKSSATSDRLGAFERGVLFERNALQTAVKNFDTAHFGEAMAPILLTLLHRLHRYTVDRNSVPSLVAAPIGSGKNKRTPSLLGRLKRRFGKSSDQIDDPLTAMQFRAIEWFFAHEPAIMAKRAAVQALRRRSDAEIFQRFPLFYVPTYHGDERLFASALFRALRLGVPSTDSTLDDMMAR